MVWASNWTVDPTGVIHTWVDQSLSQADPRPAGTGPALRQLLLDDLEDRLGLVGTWTASLCPTLPPQC